VGSKPLGNCGTEDETLAPTTAERCGRTRWSQVLEVSADARMLRAKTPFIDGQGAPHQRLYLTQSVHSLQQLRKTVETSSDIGMLRSQLPLDDG